MIDFFSRFKQSLKAILATQGVVLDVLPEHWRDVPMGALPLLAVDFELTSLDNDAKIVSAGWVEAKQQQIKLSSAFHGVVKTKVDLAQSPVIHGITEKELAQGEELQDIVTALLAYANSHIWVFHNARLDISALRRACDELQCPFPTIIHLDTLELAKYMLVKKQQPIGPRDLSLKQCVQRYGLREMLAHNALSDAMATLELAILLLAEFSPSGQEPLQQLMRTQALSVE